MIELGEAIRTLLEWVARHHPEQNADPQLVDRWERLAALAGEVEIVGRYRCAFLRFTSEEREKP